MSGRRRQGGARHNPHQRSKHGHTSSKHKGVKPTVSLLCVSCISEKTATKVFIDLMSKIFKTNSRRRSTREAVSFFALYKVIL